MKSKGFTLIELMIVVAIIAIIVLPTAIALMPEGMIRALFAPTFVSFAALLFVCVLHDFSRDLLCFAAQQEKKNNAYLCRGSFLQQQQ